MIVNNYQNIELYIILMVFTVRKGLENFYCLCPSLSINNAFPFYISEWKQNKKKTYFWQDISWVGLRT